MKFYFKHGVIGHLRRGRLRDLEQSIKEREKEQEKLRYAYEDISDPVDLVIVSTDEVDDEEAEEQENLSSVSELPKTYQNTSGGFISTKKRKKRRNKLTEAS